MPTHKKHEDILDVQIRTKFLDEYGNPIQGAIEYDPTTGYGKRVKDPVLGLTEDFYYKGGHVEIDGHTFNEDTPHDEEKIASIKEMIKIGTNREDPGYADMLVNFVNSRRMDKKAQLEAQQQQAKQFETFQQSTEIQVPEKFVAITQIARGEEVIIDLKTGHVKGTRSDNIHRPSTREESPDRESFA